MKSYQNSPAESQGYDDGETLLKLSICKKRGAVITAEEHKESEAKCDEPRVAGGPDVLS